MMRLPHDTPRSRLMALGLLVLAVGALLSVTLVPVLEWRASLAGELAEKREVLGRLTAVAGDAGRARDLQSLGQTLAQDRNLFLDGATESVRGANLQGLVSQIARESGIRIDVARALPVRDRDELKAVGIEIRFEGAIGAVQQFLIALETARPLLFVRAVSIASRRAVTGLDEAAAPLEVRFEIAAVARPKEVNP